MQVADALVAASHHRSRGWGDVVVLAACTAAWIGEVSGCRVGDIDADQWIRTVRGRTAPAPGGPTDKGSKGERARRAPIVEEIRPPVAPCALSAGPNPGARLFTGPRGGRVSTAVPRSDFVVQRGDPGHGRRSPAGPQK
ncbi:MULTISPECIES: hypothetical protein [unclassified Streptomyces]|uniref:hypothetical protein n=1 Tax=unclassified Streptomyces TaxID=2593676 RepID=UPI003D7613D9